MNFQILEDKIAVLNEEKWFVKFSRIYCNTCDSYEIPYCSECGNELRISKGQFKECKCGAPLKIKCAEGHNTCEIENWYIPKASLVRMINKIFKKFLRMIL